MHSHEWALYKSPLLLMVIIFAVNQQCVYCHSPWLSVHEYVKSLKGSEDLIDRLAGLDNKSVSSLLKLPNIFSSFDWWKCS